MTTMRVVGECFFWYRLTRVFPDKFHRAVKRLCVCVCGGLVCCCCKLLLSAIIIITPTGGIDWETDNSPVGNGSVMTVILSDAFTDNSLDSVHFVSEPFSENSINLWYCLIELQYYDSQ